MQRVDARTTLLMKVCRARRRVSIKSVVAESFATAFFSGTGGTITPEHGSSSSSSGDGGVVLSVPPTPAAFPSRATACSLSPRLPGAPQTKPRLVVVSRWKSQSKSLNRRMTSCSGPLYCGRFVLEQTLYDTYAWCKHAITSPSAGAFLAESFPAQHIHWHREASAGAAHPNAVALLDGVGDVDLKVFGSIRLLHVGEKFHKGNQTLGTWLVDGLTKVEGTQNHELFVPW